MADGVMTYEDWLRGCVHHDGRHGYVTLPCDEVLKIADFIERLRADRKTENSSEIPNNCDTCKFGEDKHRYAHICNECGVGINNYEPKDEPKTQMKTQNSNLTFEKRTMLDCYNCKRFETEDECIECHYEPKDEPQTENGECVMSSGMNTEQAKEYAKTMTYREAVSNVRFSKGIKYRKATMIKLRELAIIADRLDRKDEPTISKMEQVDKDINVRSKDEPQTERSE